MKKLIRKILKENEDEFEWTHDLDTSDAEAEIKQWFNALYHNYHFDGDGLFDLIIEAGATDLMKIKKIGAFVFDEAERIDSNAYDRGSDDYNSCDGCCDDYVWYETYDNDVRTAKEEGYEEGKSDGIEEGRSESEDEIEELKNRIQELENQLNENYNKKNSKRI